MLHATLLKARDLVAYRGKRERDDDDMVEYGVYQHGATCWMASVILLMRDNALLLSNMNDEVKEYVWAYNQDAIQALGSATHHHFTRESKICRNIPLRIKEEYLKEYQQLTDETHSHIRLNTGGRPMVFLQACAKLSGWSFERVDYEGFGRPMTRIHPGFNLISDNPNIHIVVYPYPRIDLFEQDTEKEQSYLNKILQDVISSVESIDQNKICVGCIVRVKNAQESDTTIHSRHAMGCVYRDGKFRLCQSWRGTECVDVEHMTVQDEYKLRFEGKKIQVESLHILFMRRAEESFKHTLTLYNSEIDRRVSIHFNYACFHSERKLMLFGNPPFDDFIVEILAKRKEGVELMSFIEPDLNFDYGINISFDNVLEKILPSSLCKCVKLQNNRNKRTYILYKQIEYISYQDNQVTIRMLDVQYNPIQIQFFTIHISDSYMPVILNTSTKIIHISFFLDLFHQETKYEQYFMKNEKIIQDLRPLLAKFTRN